MSAERSARAAPQLGGHQPLFGGGCGVVADRSPGVAEHPRQAFQRVRCRRRGVAAGAQLRAHVGTGKAAQHAGDAGPQIELALRKLDERGFALVRADERGLGRVQRRLIVAAVAFGAAFGHRQEERRVAVEAEVGEGFTLRVERGPEQLPGGFAFGTLSVFHAGRDAFDRTVTLLDRSDAFGAQDRRPGAARDR
jgi:hypothetical protein